MEGRQVLPGDGLEAVSGDLGGTEVVLAVEEAGQLDLGDPVGLVVAGQEALLEVFLGLVQAVLREGGAGEHLHEQVQALLQVLFHELHGYGAGGFPQVRTDVPGQEFQPFVQGRRGRLFGSARAHLHAGEGGEALLSLGIQVGASPDQHLEPHEGHPGGVRGHKDRDAVLQLGLEGGGAGSLEGQGLEGELLRPRGRDVGQEGPGCQQGQDRCAGHHFASLRRITIVLRASGPK